MAWNESPMTPKRIFCERTGAVRQRRRRVLWSDRWLQEILSSVILGCGIETAAARIAEPHTDPARSVALIDARVFGALPRRVPARHDELLRSRFELHNSCGIGSST